MKDIFSKMADSWPSEVVARERVGDFSGGILTSSTMANIDSAPEAAGPPRIRHGRKIAYPVRSLTDWMRKRSKILKTEEPDHD